MLSGAWKLISICFKPFAQSTRTSSPFIKLGVFIANAASRRWNLESINVTRKEPSTWLSWKECRKPFYQSINMFIQNHHSEVLEKPKTCQEPSLSPLFKFLCSCFFFDSITADHKSNNQSATLYILFILHIHSLYCSRISTKPLNDLIVCLLCFGNCWINLNKRQSKGWKTNSDW